MGTKSGNLTTLYAVIAVLSILLFLYLLLNRKKSRDFLFLGFCVAVVNSGYYLLSVATSLPFAMAANGVSYFGAAYSVLAMVFIIAEVCQMNPRRAVRSMLIAISTAAFLLAASGTWFGLYYRSVDLVQINGMTHLVKDYGPLHILYTIYLLSYMLLMVGIICVASRRQRLSSYKYTLLLLTAVLLNLGVWGVEQMIDINFEFLSVSYILTEIILLLIFEILRDYGIIQPGGSLISAQMLAQLQANKEQDTSETLPPDLEQLLQGFAQKAETLTSAERRILQFYIDGYETAEIPELAYISINTVKKHNRSIYQKMEVASKDELMLYLSLLRCCDRLETLAAPESTTEQHALPQE